MKWIACIYVFTIIFDNKLVSGLEDGCSYDLEDGLPSILFKLYTRQNRNEPQIILLKDDISFLKSNLNFTKPTKLQIHGHDDCPESHWGQTLKDAYLDAQDVNMINVDWRKMAMRTTLESCYMLSYIGARIAEYLDWFDDFGVKLDTVHVIGVSQGCHIVGHAGRKTKRGKIGYITLCDPPVQRNYDRPDFVTRNDALYVEAIHTNSDYYGLAIPVGHADFYPNGGASMPGCTDHMCSHMRSFYYFVNSLNRKDFQAVQCASYEEAANGTCSGTEKAYMGGSEPKNASGIFYLKTSAHEPYFLN